MFKIFSLAAIAFASFAAVAPLSHSAVAAERAHERTVSHRSAAFNQEQVFQTENRFPAPAANESANRNTGLRGGYSAR